MWEKYQGRNNGDQLGRREKCPPLGFDGRSKTLISSEWVLCGEESFVGATGLQSGMWLAGSKENTQLIPTLPCLSSLFPDFSIGYTQREAMGE